MKIKHIIYFTAISVLLLSCNKDQKFDCFKSTGEIITATESLSYFNKIEARGRISVNFVQDSSMSIDINCGKNLLNKITFSVIDSVLYLDNNNSCNWVRKLDQIPLITVHYSDLKYFRADNFYDNRFISKHQGDSIIIEYWEGSGRTWFYGDVNYAGFYVHAGSGSFAGSGNANSAMIYHAGGSQIDMSTFHCHWLHVHSKSNNDIRVYTDSVLIAELFWTGNVRYSGDAQEITRIGNGSGEIIKE